MTDQTLLQLFSQYGSVSSASVKRDHSTKESKGFAFVTFINQNEAENARNSLNHRIVDNRELKVYFKRSPTEYSPP